MVNRRSTIWVAIFVFGLAYGVLGWQLSTYHVFWSLGVLSGTILLTSALMWGGQILHQMLRLGPRSIIVLLLLSLSMTMAVAAPTLFSVLLILIATQSLARLELQTAGFNRWFTLVILVSVSSSMLSGGWLLGQYRCQLTATCLPVNHSHRPLPWQTRDAPVPHPPESPKTEPSIALHTQT